MMKALLATILLVVAGVAGALVLWSSESELGATQPVRAQPSGLSASQPNGGVDVPLASPRAEVSLGDPPDEKPKTTAAPPRAPSTQPVPTLEESEIAFVDGDEKGVIVAPGFVRVLDNEGRVVAEGGWHEGAKNGYWQYFDESGRPTLKGDYIDGLANGTWTEYLPDGSIASQTSNHEGKYHGACYFYTRREHAPELISGFYEDGKLVEKFE